MRRPSVIFAPFFAVALLSLSGCTARFSRPESAPVALAHLRGTMHGGQQPIVGAAIQLYAVGSGGDASSATPLLPSGIVSDSTGSFDISGDYTCPSSSALVYLTGSGGNPGLAATNPNSVLMAALGACGTLSSSSFISVNEVTTVASIMPIAAFAGTYTYIGSGTPDQLSLLAAFAEVNNLVNTATGATPGPGIQSGLTAPIAEINTLADIIATCVNSAGGKAGDKSACGNLFSAATPPGGSAPLNTADALIDIAQNPTNNTSALFALAMPAAPFQPTLSAAPNTWSVFLSPTVPEHANLLGEYLMTEGSGSTVHDTSGRSNDATIYGATWESAADLNFTDRNQYVQLPNALNAAQTWQFAVYAPPFGNAQLPLAPGYGDSNAFSANPSILCGTVSSQYCIIAGGYGASPLFTMFNSDGTEAGVPLSSGWHIVSILCGSTASPTHILYDGQEVSSYHTQGSTGTCPVSASGNYQIGGSSLFYDTWLRGKIAAVWAWSQPLTVAEGATAANLALAFIQSKGVVTHFLNANNTGPLLLTGLDGRSSGAGFSSQSQAWPAQMALDVPFTRLNLSTSTGDLFDGCAMFDQTYGQQIPKSSTSPVVTVLWGGYYDYAKANVVNIAANLQCMTQKAKAAGSKVVIATEISSGGPGTTNGDNLKNGLNLIIRQNALAWGADNLADLATDPVIGADQASASSNCFTNYVYPTTNCESHVTSIFQNAVNEVTGSTQAAPHSTAAASYQEMAEDRFLQLTGSAAQTITLPSCVGYSLARSVINQGSANATLATLNGETLTGSATVNPGATVTVTPLPGDPHASGCSWTTNAPPVTSPVPAICTTWGDSLTQGGEDGGYQTIAHELAFLGSCGVIYNQGVGGQTSTQIAVREGGVQATATIQGGVIPASGGVQIVFQTGYEAITSQGPLAVDITINGVEGIISPNATASVITFTRSQAGSAVTSPANSPVTVNVGNLTSGFNLFWVGANNPGQTSQVLSDLAGMVAALPSPKKFLVLSTMSSNTPNNWAGQPGHDQIVSLDQQIAAAYPNNFIDIRSMLIAGYNPTNGEDVIDHNHDVQPSSLRALDAFGNTGGAIADATTCNINMGPGGAHGYYTMTIDSEKIYVLNTDNTLSYITSCIRGYGGTTATTHAQGAYYQGADFIHLNSNPADVYIAIIVDQWIRSH